LTTSGIAKLCAAGVLLTASSRAAEPDGASLDRLASTATVAQLDALENCSLVSLKRVYFSAGHSIPSRGEAATLNQIANTLAEQTGSIVELRGYADEAPSSAVNLAMSMDRANRIARFLAAHGVASKRILILGLGEVDPGSSSRRVEHQRVDVRVFAPPSAVTNVRHDGAAGSFIQDTWGGKINP
jgi:outer membrane protein OmpA-like peptidoglycan-associated protein